MTRRITTADYLASLDQLEEKLDRSTKALERCIHHLTAIEERVRREQQDRAGYSRALGPRSPAANAPLAPFRDPARRLQNG